MADSTFAIRMLAKQGWKEGDGLGKNRDGISKPIKAFLKTDKAGVGQDLGTNLTDQWWLRVFNDAAKNTVTKTNEVSEEKLPQNSLYAGFRRGSTLKQGKEEKDPDCSSGEEEEQDDNPSNVPTLDDIHKYCGGATGHRAATLGIKMTGKLKRAADHERLYAERLNQSIEATNNSDTDISEKTVKRKKKKRKDAEKDDLQESVASMSPKKMREDDNCYSECTGSDPTSARENIQAEKVKRKKSKKMKRRREEKEQDESNTLDECADSISTTQRKKSKSNHKNHTDSVIEENIESVDCDSDEKQKRKKKKKRKD